MNCIRDTNKNSVLRFIKTKHSKIKIDTEYTVGEVQIKSIRKYGHSVVRNYEYHEVDIIFKGKLFLRTWNGGTKEVQLKDLPTLSKIRTYRVMRHYLMPLLNSHLSKFGIELHQISDISKIKWVE